MRLYLLLIITHNINPLSNSSLQFNLWRLWLTQYRGCRGICCLCMSQSKILSANWLPVLSAGEHVCMVTSPDEQLALFSSHCLQGMNMWLGCSEKLTRNAPVYYLCLVHIHHFKLPRYVFNTLNDTNPSIHPFIFYHLVPRGAGAYPS